jgi:hypothetical protein
MSVYYPDLEKALLYKKDKSFFGSFFRGDKDEKSLITISADESGSMRGKNINFNGMNRLELLQKALEGVIIPNNVNYEIYPFGSYNISTEKYNIKEFNKIKPHTGTNSINITTALKLNPHVWVFFGDGTFDDNNLSNILKNNIGNNLRKIYFILPSDTSLYIIDKLKKDVGEAIEVASNKHGIAIEFTLTLIDAKNNKSVIQDIFDTTSRLISGIFPTGKDINTVGDLFAFDKDLTAGEIANDILDKKIVDVNKLFIFMLNTLAIRATSINNPLWGKIHKICIILNSIIEGSYNDDFTTLKNKYPKGSAERTAMESIKALSFGDPAEAKKYRNSLKKDDIIGYLIVDNNISMEDFTDIVQSKGICLNVSKYLENHKIVLKNDEGFPILKDGLDTIHYKNAAKLFFNGLNVSDMVMFSVFIRILGSKDKIDMSENVYISIYNSISKEDVIKYLLSDEIDDIFYATNNYIAIANFFYIYGDKMFGKEYKNKINKWKTIRMFAKVINSLKKIKNYTFNNIIKVEKRGGGEIISSSDINGGDIFIAPSFKKDPCPSMPSIVYVRKITLNNKGGIKVEAEYLDNPTETDDTLVYYYGKNKPVKSLGTLLASNVSVADIEKIRDYLMEIKKNKEVIFDYVNSPPFDKVKYDEIMIEIRKIIFKNDGLTEMEDKEITISVDINDFINIFGYSNVIVKMVKAKSNMSRKDIEDVIFDFYNDKTIIEDKEIYGTRLDNNTKYLLSKEELDKLKEDIINEFDLEEPKNMIETISDSFCICGDDIMHHQSHVKMHKCLNPLHNDCFKNIVDNGILKRGDYFTATNYKCPFCNVFYDLLDIPDVRIRELLEEFPNGPPKNHLWRCCCSCDKIMTGPNMADNGCAEIVFPDNCEECKNKNRSEEINSLDICYKLPNNKSAIHDGHCVHITGNGLDCCLMCKDGYGYEPEDHAYGCTSYDSNDFPDIKIGDLTISYDWLNPSTFHFIMFSDNVDWEAYGKTPEEFGVLIKSIVGDVEFENLKTYDACNL